MEYLGRQKQYTRTFVTMSGRRYKIKVTRLKVRSSRKEGCGRKNTRKREIEEESINVEQ